MARKYPAAYRGQAILMYVERTADTDPLGLPIYELRVAVEVPPPAPRYPVVLQLPVGPPEEQLLVPGNRVAAYLAPADRQRVELDFRAARKHTKPN